MKIQNTLIKNIKKVIKFIEIFVDLKNLFSAKLLDYKNRKMKQVKKNNLKIILFNKTFNKINIYKQWKIDKN